MITRLSQAEVLCFGVRITAKSVLKNMSTARLAGKILDDVLYPEIEPYETGMLQVGLKGSH